MWHWLKESLLNIFIFFRSIKISVEVVKLLVIYSWNYQFKCQFVINNVAMRKNDNNTWNKKKNETHTKKSYLNICSTVSDAGLFLHFTWVCINYIIWTANWLLRWCQYGTGSWAIRWWRCHGFRFAHIYLGSIAGNMLSDRGLFCLNLERCKFCVWPTKKNISLRERNTHTQKKEKLNFKYFLFSLWISEKRNEKKRRDAEWWRERVKKWQMDFCKGIHVCAKWSHSRYKNFQYIISIHLFINSANRMGRKKVYMWNSVVVVDAGH